MAKASAQRGRKVEAVAAGVSAGTLGAMERGRTYPRWDTVEAIAGALGASVVDLAQLAEKLEE